MSAYDSPFTMSYFAGSSHVAVMEVYSDASVIGGHLAIGTLLFRKKNIKPFDKKWRLMLRRHGLTHFHMTDCNSGQGEFRDKSEKECDDAAREAISILLEFAVKGCIFNVKISDFNEIITPQGLMPNPFTLGVWFTLFDLRNWSDENDPIARISYIFEAGDEHQRDANNLLVGIAEQPERAAAFRYRNHAFVPKLASTPTQAADILAWHGAKHSHRRSEGNFRLRGDFNEIINRLHITDGVHDPEWLRELVKIAEHRGGRFGNQMAGLAFKMTDANFPQVVKKMREILHSEGDPGENLQEFLGITGVVLPRA